MNADSPAIAKGSHSSVKVAVVYPFFPHYRAAIFRELLDRGKHDYLLVGDRGSLEPSIAAWQIDDPRRLVVAPCRKLGSSLHFQRGLLRLSVRRDLSTIIYLGNPYFISTWASVIAARLTGKRVLFWTHGWNRGETGMKAWLRTLFYQLSDGLLLYGDFARKNGIARGFAPERLHVIYNSLDYETQKKLRTEIPPERLLALKRQLFEQPELPMVICPARLTRQCRFDLLLNAQAQLAKEGHPINVLLVGDGPEREALEAQARRLAVPVKFYGACYNEEMLAGLIMAAHVTVSPGKVGLTAIHSLAYGTPVITHSDHEAQGPEWEAIRPGHTGDFFQRDNTMDLVQVIRRWTTVSQPDAARRQECWQIVEQFYNPEFQRRAIDRAVDGEPAEDCFQATEERQAA